jgi:pyruvate formate lyase activating enzyme
MTIGGFLRFSLIDFPEKVAAVVFTQGCNFRCPFCHNPELVLPRRFQLPIEEGTVIQFLKTRVGKLDGVVITGGEPLIQEGLDIFLREIKNMGYAVKLDTNGSYPTHLKKLLDGKLIDYLAMDIKASPDNYAKIAGVPVNLDYICKTITLIRNSGVPYEFRTTVVKNLHQIEEFEDLAGYLLPEEKYVLQNFSPSVTVGPSKLDLEPFDKEEMSRISQIFQNYGIIPAQR